MKQPIRLFGVYAMLASALLLGFTLQAAATTTVTVTSPANGSTVSTSITVQASATSTNGVDGWHIYDNSTDVYSAGAVNSISAPLTLTPGSHTLVVRAWDSISGFGDQTITVNAVNGTVVNVSTPADGASNLSSPVTLQASATSPNGVDGWHIYDNSNDVFSAGAVSSITASLNLAPGSHRLVVRAWDRISGFGDQTINITVGTGGYQCTLQFCETDDPPNAWQNCGACGNDGGTGTPPTYSFNQGQNLAGRSNVADFQITGPANTGGYEWHENGGLGFVVNNAVYEFDLYIPSAYDPNRNIQAIEFELQQTQNDVIYNMAWQFDYQGDPNSSTMNLMIFNYTTKHWEPSGLTLTRFSLDAWHHVRAHYSVSGNQVIHDWIEIDGTRYMPTQNNSHTAFSTSGTTPVFNNAFQLDLPGFDNALYHVYFDHANVGYNQSF